MKDLPKVVVATDVCIFKIFEGELYVYLTEVHSKGYYQGMKTLPGSLVYSNETTYESVRRVIEQRTSIDWRSLFVDQFYTFSDLDRDKRSRAVSVAYYALTRQKDNAGFVPYNKVGKLAYDHNNISKVAFDRVASKLQYTTIAVKLLPKEFTFAELQRVYEIFGSEKLDKRNFRKKIDKLGILTETDKYKQEGRMRPAKLYKFKSDKIKEIDIL
jgi:8-oxo-dGTP diphosphatase